MTLVTDILDRAARQCSVTAPSDWVSDTTTTVAELRDFLAETVDDIQERVDLPSPLTAQTTITGDGSETYSLPTAFKRLTRGPLPVYETSPVRRRAQPVTDDGTWADMDNERAFGGGRFYRIQGYPGAHTISFLPELETGGSVLVSYTTTAWLSGGASEFTGTTQTTLLPRRLLECGIVWRYRERKGLEYDGKLAEYDALMARMVNDQRGRRAIEFGPAAHRHPWDVPVPDVIPST